MAGRWSGEHCVLEFKDLQASALAIDCIGKWALLAGRKNLAFVDLDQSKPTVMKVTRQSKWEVSNVQWNRHASHAYRFVTACNQRLDVFDFREGSALHLCSLKAHTRNVSDIDWSPFDVNIVASCSVDTFTYLWDVRDPKKPVKIFQTVSGAYQVKWNKVTNNLFATTHDGDIRIWDPRKGNAPINYISAHPSKIHGLDWSPSDEYKLVTASQDCTIRFWDYTNPRRSESMINSGNPVWRARYTPFGGGVMSVVLPQLRRGENSLYLWNKDSELPIHTFVGHKDIILEFQWRKPLEGCLDHHLVTWSRDQTLRIWKVDPTLQKLCGHEVDESLLIEDGPALPHTSDLHCLSAQEVARQDQIDASQQLKVSTAMGGGANGGQPHSKMSPSPTNASGNVVTPQSPLHPPSLNGANNLDVPTAPANRPPIASKLVDQEETSTAMADRNVKVEVEVKVFSQVMYPSESFQDTQVPFPRTCGARFCSNDYLVMFSVPSAVKKVYEDCKTTPRAMFDLVKFTSQPQWKRPANNSLFHSKLFYGSSPQTTDEGVTISDWFTEKHSKSRHHRHGHHHHHHHHHRGPPGRPRGESSTEGRRGSESQGHNGHRGETIDKDKQSKRLLKVGAIKIYDIATINPISKFLAQNYKLDQTNVMACCEHNAKVASQIGRKDLVQLWTLLCHMAHPRLKPSPNVDQGRPWATHPFGRSLVDKFLAHYTKHQDVQTLAMICCMLWDRDTRVRPLAPPLQGPLSSAALHSYTSSPGGDSTAPFEFAVTSKPQNSDKDQYVQTTLTFHHHHHHNTTTTTIISTTPTNLLIPSTTHQAESPTSSPTGGWQLLSVMKGKRSLSWSSESVEVTDKDPVQKEMEAEKMLHLNNCKMLNPFQRTQQEQIKQAYANILYKWQLLNQRAQVLKHTTCGSQPSSSEIVFKVACFNCQRSVSSFQCEHCKFLALNCAICHIGVRGTANVCLACGHGGHSSHMQDWFRNLDLCPTGCGCHCLEENRAIAFT